MPAHRSGTRPLQSGVRWPRRRELLLGGVVAALAVAVLVTVPRFSPSGTPAAGSAAGRGPVRPDPAATLLHRWDAARARAWAHGDVVALGRLYVPHSSAGAADLRLLRAYLARGYVVRGMSRQVLAVHVSTRTPGRLRLRVTDRLAGAQAVGGGEGVALPGSAAATRVLTLQRWHGEWLMASVVAT